MKRVVLCAIAACGGQIKPISDADIDTRAAAVVDAFVNSDAIVTPDGHVVFTSNRDGLPQLYVGEVDHPDKAPVRLPVPKERVEAPAVMPDGKTIVFLSDVGTDAKFHIFRIGIDGTNLVDLTPGGDQRRSSLVVARTSGLLVYTSHTLEDQTTHIYAQTLDGPPREIYRDPKVGDITSFTADGSRLLFVQAISDSEQVAFVIDTSTGVPTRIYPREGDKITIGAAELSADGNHVFVDSEEPGRPPRMLRLDATTGAEQARFDEPTAVTASFQSIAASPAGDVIVVGVDAGDHSELRILDARELHPLPGPAFPLGSFRLGQFTRDGTRLTLDTNTPAGPTHRTRSRRCVASRGPGSPHHRRPRSRSCAPSTAPRSRSISTCPPTRPAACRRSSSFTAVRAAARRSAGARRSDSGPRWDSLSSRPTSAARRDSASPTWTPTIASTAPTPSRTSRPSTSGHARSRGAMAIAS